MNTRLPLALLCTMLVAGCAPEDYVESPAVKSQFSKVLPNIDKSDVEEISICTYSRDERPWSTSLEFDDGVIMNYRLDVENKSVIFESSTTRAQRNLHRKSEDYGCLGHFGYSAYSGYEVSGTYRLHVNAVLTSAYVYKTLPVQKVFGDEDKQIITVAAKAVLDAQERHKKMVPNEVSWGITQKDLLSVFNR